MTPLRRIPNVSLALCFVLLAACDSTQRAPAFVCETDAQRKAATDIVTACVSSAESAWQLDRCEYVAKSVACVEVQGFVDRDAWRAVPCSQAATVDERETCER
jgi:hypothetical protein